MLKKLAVSGIGLALLATPAIGFAQSQADTLAQIQTLLTQVRQLQSILDSLLALDDDECDGGLGCDVVIPPLLPIPNDCPVLTYNMGLDDTDENTAGQVTVLQRFLAQDRTIYPEGLVTGYFGPATERAVKRWQAQNGVVSSGSPETTGYGYVGPKTRQAIKDSCANNPQTSFTATPTNGAAPLSVVFSADVTLANGQFVADAGSYKIDFGDGSEQVFECTGSSTFCEGPHTANHTYATAGTYTASLIHYGYFGLPPGITTVATITITVTGATSTANKLEVAPATGAAPLTSTFFVTVENAGTYTLSFGDGGSQVVSVPQIQCVTTPCNPPTQTLIHTYQTAGTYTAQLTAVGQTTVLASTSVTATEGGAVGCPIFIRSLEKGMRGDDVRQLQQFLVGEGYLDQENTSGYFGPLTEDALKEWQAANGVVSSGTPDTTGWGRLGPSTRAAIARICSGEGVALTATPRSGEAPLTVQFRAKSGGDYEPGDHTIEFGDGASSIMEFSENVNFDLQASHTYSSAGAYNVKVIRVEYPEEYNNPNCTGFCAEIANVANQPIEVIVARTTITVTAATTTPTDVCPNIDGEQTSVPSGKKLENGQCVDDTTSDVCPNIEGVQTAVPTGMTKDASGNCTSDAASFPNASRDVGPNCSQDALEQSGGSTAGCARQVKSYGACSLAASDFAISKGQSVTLKWMVKDISADSSLKYTLLGQSSQWGIYSTIERTGGSFFSLGSSPLDWTVRDARNVSGTGTATFTPEQTTRYFVSTGYTGNLQLLQSYNVDGYGPFYGCTVLVTVI